MSADTLLNIMVYIAIPLLTVVFLSVTKRKLLWVAPLISTLLAGITYIGMFAVNGIGPAELLGNSEWRAFFLLAMGIQLVIVIAFVVISYFVARMGDTEGLQ